jgi:hypothetical protein
LPVFRYKSHISIDCRYGFIRAAAATSATHADGRMLRHVMADNSSSEVSDYTEPAVLRDALPKAQWLLADRGYDADWFRGALREKGIKPSIPGCKSRNKPSNMTSADINDATASKSCSVASKTGDASLPAMTDAPTYSSRLSLLPLPSSSGSNQWVLTLHMERVLKKLDETSQARGGFSNVVFVDCLDLSMGVEESATFDQHSITAIALIDTDQAYLIYTNGLALRARRQ